MVNDGADPGQKARSRDELEAYKNNERIKHFI
jgi:hypothetical protein